jgi:hypothetical protein
MLTRLIDCRLHCPIARTDQYRVFAFAMCLALAVVGSPVVRAQMDVSFAPMLVSLSVASGSKAGFDIGIDNSSTARVTEFKAYVAEISQQADGEYRVVEQGSSAFSCKNWIKLSTSQLRVDPGRSASVTGVISVPRGARGGAYAAIVFELVPEAQVKQAGTASSIIVPRVVIPIELTITGPGAKKTLAVTGFRVRSASEDQLLASLYGRNAVMLSAEANNNGNTHVFTRGTITLRDADGRRIRQVPVGGGRGIILPGASVQMSSVLPGGLPAGEYIADVSVKYGGLRPATAKVSFAVGGRAGDAELREASGIASILATPERLELGYPPGATAARSIVVANTSDTKLCVDGRATLLAYDEEGEVASEGIADATYSCAEWVEMRPTAFELAPKAKQTVRVVVSIPKGVSGSRYAGLVFSASPADSQSSAHQGSWSTEAGCDILLTVGKDNELEKDAAISPLRVTYGGPSLGFLMEATVTNTGNTHIIPKVMFIIKRRLVPMTTPGLEYVGPGSFVEVDRVNLSEVTNPVLPMGSRAFRVAYTAHLEPGRYVAEVVIEYGGGTRLYNAEEFTVGQEAS